MAEYVLDEVKMRVAELLGAEFSNYSAEDIAELEAALRSDDPKEFDAICAKWADMPGAEPPPEPPLPRCRACRRPMRFGYPPQCEKHPYKD